jgi:spore germination protein KC
MFRKNILIMATIFAINILLCTGCWNYVEIDQLAIVAGVAIDKTNNDTYKMTVEIIEFGGETGTRELSRKLSIEGKTIFDAARNAITVVGKKLYWSHLHAVILSQEVAEENVIKVIEWFMRDHETRADVNIFISKGIAASEVLQQRTKIEDIISFDLRAMIDNHELLAKAPHIEIWELANSIESKGMSSIAPAVQLETVNDKVTPKVEGTAIIKGDKLIGFLDGNETKDLRFLMNEITGGLIIKIEDEDHNLTPISLEIFDSQTKVKPIVKGDSIKFDIDISTTVSLAEVQGTKDFIQEKDNRMSLERSVEKALEARLNSLIDKLQHVYNTDLIGLGNRLREDRHDLWKNIEGNWSDVFKKVDIDVSVDIHIKNSGMMSKPLKIGE